MKARLCVMLSLFAALGDSYKGRFGKDAPPQRLPA